MNKGNRKKKSVISAKRMIIPSVIAIFFMHALIVINTVRINNLGAVISGATQRSFALVGMSNGYSQTTDQLAATALSYVNDGDTEELADYFEELGQIQGSYAAMQEMLKGGEDAEMSVTSRMQIRADAAPEESAAQRLTASVDAVMERAQTEMTAMVLAAQARGMDLNAWPQLSSIELPEEINSLPPEAKVGKAHEMLLNSGYQSKRGDVQRNLSIAVSMSNNESAAGIQRLSTTLSMYRLEQWVLIVLIIGTMTVMIVLLFTKLLIPLEKSVELVQHGESLPTEYGFSELRRLAESYDELMIHRNQMEENLRELSYTDALTGLPNRLAYQDFLKMLSNMPEDTSLAIYSMDVDGLKETNDKRGHIFGDMLLRESAACILKIFGDETGKNVFRTGGDEFVAFRLHCTEEEGERALDTFREEQNRRGISISAGCSYAASIRDEKLQQMFEVADHNMYEVKAAAKRQAADTHSDT